MASPLADLDELILKCRDERAKSYIKEAVACYKAGALRSAIVSAWIAIVFDLIEKLKELSLAGDQEADRQIKIYEKALSEGDITQALRFEKDLLKLAQEKLDLISKIELIDLERVQFDRHRCAHPSMNMDGEIFNPSAELARCHIRSAIEHLLQYPPAQGKYALERILKDINSEYFPSTALDIQIALNKSPLAYPRESLVRSLIIVLLKDLVTSEIPHKEEIKKATVLSTIEELHPHTFEKTLEQIVSNLFRELNDSQLIKAVTIISRLPNVWGFLDNDVTLKLTSYVKALPETHLDDLDLILKSVHLKEAATYRTRLISRKEAHNFIFFDTPREVSDQIIKLYASSNSFEQANNFSEVVARYAFDYDKTQIQTLLNACSQNDQILESFNIGNVILALRKSETVSKEEFDFLLSEAGLYTYMS